MKYKNNAGFAHIALLLFVVVAIIGVGLFTLRATHADPPHSRERREEYRYNHAKLVAESKPPGSPSRIVKTAQWQLGYSEKPVNKVKYFEWKGDTAEGSGPWCAVFVSWVWHVSGSHEADPPYESYKLRISVRQIADEARSHNRFHDKPKKGYAVIYGGYSHVGIVESATKHTLKVIEGNAALHKGGPDKYVIRRVINRDNLSNVPGGGIIGYAAPPKYHQ